MFDVMSLSTLYRYAKKEFDGERIKDLEKQVEDGRRKIAEANDFISELAKQSRTFYPYIYCSTEYELTEQHVQWKRMQCKGCGTTFGV